MSLVGVFGQTPQPVEKLGRPVRTEPSADAGGDMRRDAPARADAPAASAGGGGAPGDATLAARGARMIPPVMAARDPNATSSARPGGDGGDAAALAREARETLASDAEAAKARRSAEIRQDRLVSQEILSRIPVPVEALPRLAVEAQRVVEEATPQAERPARVA